MLPHELNLAAVPNAIESAFVPDNEGNYFRFLLTLVSEIDKDFCHHILADELMYEDIVAARTEAALVLSFSYEKMFRRF